MSLRIIAGSSGQGKTRLVLEEAIRLSEENPKQNCYIIVPEQFSLEMQRKLVESHPKHGYFNIDVLSFYQIGRARGGISFFQKKYPEGRICG